MVLAHFERQSAATTSPVQATCQERLQRVKRRPRVLLLQLRHVEHHARAREPSVAERLVEQRPVQGLQRAPRRGQGGVQAVAPERVHGHDARLDAAHGRRDGREEVHVQLEERVDVVQGRLGAVVEVEQELVEVRALRQVERCPARPSVLHIPCETRVRSPREGHGR